MNKQYNEITDQHNTPAQQRRELTDRLVMAQYWHNSGYNRASNAQAIRDIREALTRIGE